MAFANERMAFIKLHFKNHRIIIQQECTIYKPKNISVYADMRKGVVDQKMQRLKMLETKENTWEFQ